MGSWILNLFSLLAFIYVGKAKSPNISLALKQTNVLSKIIPPHSRRYSNDILKESFFLSSDKCQQWNSSNEEKRKTKKALNGASKALTASAHGVAAVGEACPEIFGLDTGGTVKAVAEGMHAAATVMQVTADLIEVESEELEYMKCFKAGFDDFKKDFDDFKKDFDTFKNETKQEFRKLNEKLDELKVVTEQGFIDTQKLISELQNDINEVKELVIDLKENTAMDNYDKEIIRVELLKEKYYAFTRELGKGAKNALLSPCVFYDPILSLKLIDRIYSKRLLELRMSTFYALLKHTWIKTIVDIFQIGEMATTCFAIAVNKTAEEVEEYTKTDILPIVGNISKSFYDKLKEVKLATIETNIPKIIIDAKIELNTYLNKRESWAEWVWAGWEDDPWYTPTFFGVAGEAKAYGRSAIIWCEVTDNKERVATAEQIRNAWDNGGRATFENWLTERKETGINCFGFPSQCPRRGRLFFEYLKLLYPNDTNSQHTYYKGIMVYEGVHMAKRVQSTENMKFMVTIHDGEYAYYADICV